jgi:CheY-like chemotaxis protein
MKQRMQEGTCPRAIIFLDINMPEMNGFDFLDELKVIAGDHFDQGCKIVMVTSSLNEKDRERAMSYPFVSNYMEKPLTLEYLSSLS